MCQDDLAHLTRGEIAGGAPFIQERDIQRAGAHLVDQLVDRRTEQAAEFVFS